MLSGDLAKCLVDMEEERAEGLLVPAGRKGQGAFQITRQVPDAREGKLFSMKAPGTLAYSTDICVGCCAAVPEKFGKQLAAPKAHTALRLS